MQKINAIAAGLALGAMVFGATPGMAGDGISPPDERPAKGKRLADGAGAGGGLVVGGLLGGPIGMMVGAGLGTWLGNRVVDAGRAEEALADTTQVLDATRRELDESVAQRQALELDLVDSERNLAHLERLATQAQEANSELRTALASGLEMQVMFRTGQSALTAESAQQVSSLAGVLAGVDGLTVQLDGYADPRGDERYNEELTAARVAAVEQALLAGGLQGQQLAGFAHGERAYASEEGDYDAYALERRVDISLQAVESPVLGATDAPPTQERSDVLDLALVGDR